MEVVAVLAVTVLAVLVIAPDWVDAVLGGLVDPWPIPDRLWWAVAVPVLGAAAVVLVRRTGQPTAVPEPPTAGTWNGSVPAAGWPPPASFTPAPTIWGGGGAQPGPTVAAAPIEVPQAWLSPAASAAPAAGLVEVPVDVVERTQVRTADRAAVPSARRWSGRLDDGTEIALDGPVVIGRNPALAPGEVGVRLVSVADPSISKTHLRLDPDGETLLVVDRHSTNGVEIRTAAGDVVDCVPGAPTPVPDGGTIRFGDRALVLHLVG